LIQINRRPEAVRPSRRLSEPEPPAIVTPATYSAPEHLRDGRPIEIRAQRPDDEAGMLDAVAHTGAQSLQRRFFVPKRSISEKEKAFFMHIDFVNHVSLVAEIEEGGKRTIIGGGRYIVTTPGEAEVAFVVVDAWQRQGIGALLTRHLVGLARAAGLKQLAADVLPENTAMRTVLGKFGFRSARSLDPQVVHLTLALI
jgi:RimJ/RimL family protein N-acetyltransferase